MPEIEALIGVNQLEENGNLHHLGDVCACAIEQLLKLNRVDDALKFFKSIPYILSDNNHINQKNRCLVLLLPYVIQQKTPMEDIEALIGINQLEENGNVSYLLNACTCAIKRLLELDRFDDAQKFFKSIPLSQNSNSFKEECLNLLNSYTNG